MREPLPRIRAATWRRAVGRGSRRLPRVAARRQLRAARRAALPGAAPTGTSSRSGRRALGAFKDPSLLRDRVSGSDRTTSARTSGRRPRTIAIVDIDYCINGRRHPPSRAARRHRHPRVDGRRPAGRLTLALGRLAKGAFAARAAGHPAARRRSSPGCSRRARRRCPTRTRYREIARDLQSLPEARAVLRRRADRSSTIIEPMVEHRRRRRDRVTVRFGRGLRVGRDRLLRPALLAASRGRAQRSLAAAVRADSLQHLGRLRHEGVLIFYFDAGRHSRHPIDIEKVRELTAARDHDLGRPGRPASSSGVRRHRRPSPVQQVRAHREPQRPLPRVDDAGRSARRSAAARAARGTPRDDGDGASRPSRRCSSSSHPVRSVSPTRCARCRTSACRSSRS